MPLNFRCFGWLLAAWLATAPTFGQERAPIANAPNANELLRQGVRAAYLANFLEAIGLFDQALALRDDWPEAYLNRGTAQASVGRFAEAIADFDEAIALRPDYTDAYYNRGAVHLFLRDTVRSRRDLNTVIAYDPDYVDAYLVRGQLRQTENDLSGSCEDFTRVLRVGSSFAAEFAGQYCQDRTVLFNRPDSAIYTVPWPAEQQWKSYEYREAPTEITLRVSPGGVDTTESGRVTVYRDLTEGSLEAIMNEVHQEQRLLCARRAKLTVLDQDPEATYPWIMFSIECRRYRRDQRPESQVWHLMAGKRAYYLTYHATDADGLTDEQIASWGRYLKQARLTYPTGEPF